MNFARVALTGSIWSLGQMIVERGLQAALFVVVAKLLGPQEFGVAAIAISLPMVFVATFLGTVQVVVQRDDATPIFLSTTFWFAIGLGAAFSLVTLALSPLIAYLIHSPQLVLYMAPAAFAPLFTSLGVVGEGLLTRKFEFRLLALRRTIGLIGSAPICIALAFAGFGPWSLIANTLLTSLISSSVALFGSGFVPSLKVSRTELVNVMRIATYTSLAQASIGANTRLADPIIGIFAGPAAAGTFRLARTIIDLVLSVTYQPLTNVLLPIFSRFAAEEERAVAATLQIMFISAIILSVPFLALFIAADSVSSAFASKDWRAVGPLVVWMAVAYPASAAISPAQAFSTARGWFRLGLAITLVDLVLNVFLLALGAAHGPRVLGAMFSLRAWLAAGIVLEMIRRAEPLLTRARMHEALKPAYIALALGVVLLLARGLSPVLGTSIVASALVLALATLIFAGLLLVTSKDQIRRIGAAMPLPPVLRQVLNRLVGLPLAST